MVGNPKIAEFLKNYKFVKEFGEGVNRMCNELEQAGLKEPAYYTNAFMLQTVIYNTNAGKTVSDKATDLSEKSAIESEKSAIESEKSTIESEKSTIESEKSAIESEKSAIEMIKSAIEQQKYNEPSRMNILKVYEQIEKNQIFGSKEIEEILGCSSSTARAVLLKLKEMKIVTEVKGKGKGKYVFIE